MSRHKEFSVSRSNHMTIFTLFNNFLRWTYFGPTRFILRWTALVDATSRVSDVTHKWNSWRLIDVMSVEHNNQTRRLITPLCRLFCKILIKTKMNLNDVKTKCKYKRWISFFWGSLKYERNEFHAKLTWHPSCVIYFARDPLHSYFDEPQKKWNSFPKYTLVSIVGTIMSYFGQLWKNIHIFDIIHYFSVTFLQFQFIWH